MSVIATDLIARCIFCLMKHFCRLFQSCCAVKVTPLWHAGSPRWRQKECEPSSERHVLAGTSKQPEWFCFFRNISYVVKLWKKRKHLPSLNIFPFKMSLFTCRLLPFWDNWGAFFSARTVHRLESTIRMLPYRSPRQHRRGKKHKPIFSYTVKNKSQVNKKFLPCYCQREIPHQLGEHNNKTNPPSVCLSPFKHSLSYWLLLALKSRTGCILDSILTAMNFFHPAQLLTLSTLPMPERWHMLSHFYYTTLNTEQPNTAAENTRPSGKDKETCRGISFI